MLSKRVNLFFVLTKKKNQINKHLQTEQQAMMPLKHDIAEA